MEQVGGVTLLHVAGAGEVGRGVAQQGQQQTRRPATPHGQGGS